MHVKLRWKASAFLNASTDQDAEASPDDAASADGEAASDEAERNRARSVLAEGWGCGYGTVRTPYNSCSSKPTNFVSSSYQCCEFLPAFSISTCAGWVPSAGSHVTNKLPANQVSFRNLSNKAGSASLMGFSAVASSSAQPAWLFGTSQWNGRVTLTYGA